jgi:hypothetical protein
MRSRVTVVLLVAGAMLVSLVGPAFADDDDDDGAGAEPVFPLTSLPPSAGDNVVLTWNEEALQCVRTLRERPMVVARALFVLHTTMYDAWAPYDAKAVPTQRPSGWRRSASAERTAANKHRAMSHAAHLALRDVFPTCEAEFDQQLADLGYAAGDTAPAAQMGRQAAQRVVDSRRTDGANQAGGYADTTGYQPVNTATTNTNPWRWQPLPGQTAMTPQWGRVRPFNPKTLSEVQIPAPRQESSETIDDILAESARLNDTSKMIAEYWADGPQTETPPGHWNVIAQWLSRRHRQSTDQDVKMFFALNGGLLDASIGVWDAKYDYDFARPITAIRTLRAGQTVTAWRGPGLGTQTFPAQEWRSYIPTPPFPEYISGHSSFSCAAAAVLKDVRAAFGGNDTLGASVTFQPGQSVIEPGVTPRAPVTLSWAKFEDAANQAGQSRRYGGIHWLDGDIYSRDLGKKLGEQAFSIAKKHWEGG